jgi:formiminotetrahydrofolate cyclodeaminase
MREDRFMPSAAEQPIATFLQSLAAREPTPGGGAAAALHAAQAAALVAMVARYSDRDEDADANRLAERVADDADALRRRASELIDADMAAFGAVAAAYRMPRESEEEKAARREAIAAASIGAAQPPADVLAVAASVVALCEALHPVANRNVITDIAAAADAARAAAATGRLNVEINLSGISDEQARAALTQALDGVDQILVAADALSARVRSEIA